MLVEEVVKRNTDGGNANQCSHGGKQLSVQFSSVQFSRSVMSDCLRPHELQHVRKVMANLDSILKSRDITLPTKVHLVKS